ncbi:MAG: FkbM family methyltransferase [Leptolyngbyaceae cyanobacterium bins.59]|nr:FkbM family methyltransferase [Leptolyngbyaceae cyanobacterium bins.59]
MSTIREYNVAIGDKTYLITSDDDYLEQINKNGFELEMVPLFKVLASNSTTILDIGANIGCTALLFGKLAQEVYAFEPSPTTFSFLEKNITSSGLTNIFPKNIGLGTEPGEYPLTLAPSNRAVAFVSNQTQAGTGHIVEKIIIRPLDEVVQSLHLTKVDFIKIDVEGFEGQVLKGATQTLKTHQPIVVLELNHWCLNAFQRTSVPDFFDLLRSQFPILLAVDGSGYLDLYDESECHLVMYYHILKGRYPNIVAAFDEAQLRTFRQLYQPHFTPEIPEGPIFYPLSFREYLKRGMRKVASVFLKLGHHDRAEGKSSH